MNTGFIIVTGLSGSGKSAAANVLEDMGYFCIDNMPPQLIMSFAEICEASNEIKKVAMVTDIRGGEAFSELPDIIAKLKEKGASVKLLFVDAASGVIKHRYKETRRKHPLFDAENGDIDKAIAREITALNPLKRIADYYIDSSLTSTAKFKEIMLGMFLDDPSESMVISCMSFGFKYGIPPEADLVFDVRCLPNPFYVPELKTKTGLDKDVQDYVLESEESQEYLGKLCELIEFLIPMYLKEGKSQLVIAFGCTGGRHRSVTFAENMCSYINESSYKAHTIHRDIDK